MPRAARAYDGARQRASQMQRRALYSLRAALSSSSGRAAGGARCAVRAGARARAQTCFLFARCIAVLWGSSS
jgi:hypothetical protein